jgi:hypothetical protein
MIPLRNFPVQVPEILEIISISRSLFGRTITSFAGGFPAGRWQGIWLKAPSELNAARFWQPPRGCQYDFFAERKIIDVGCCGRDRLAMIWRVAIATTRGSAILQRPNQKIVSAKTPKPARATRALPYGVRGTSELSESGIA